MKKFRASNGTKIEELEVIKETDKQIVFVSKSGYTNREAKITYFTSWHNTKEDAINYLIAEEQTKIDDKLRQIEYHRKNIVRIAAL